MGATTEIYFATDASPEEVAEALTRMIPNGQLTREPDFDEPFVARILPDGTGSIGGTVHRNDLSGALLMDQPGDPSDVSVDDTYPVIWVLKETPKDEPALRRLSVEVFQVLAERLSCPLLMTFDVDLLVMASVPGEAIMQFSDGVTPYSADRDVWQRFRAVTRGPLQQ